MIFRKRNHPQSENFVKRNGPNAKYEDMCKMNGEKIKDM